VLTPPDGLDNATLAAALARCWGLNITSLAYLPVGWGSHHWEAAGAAGSRWFVTADDLEARKLSGSEPLTAAFSRLRASLATAVGLRGSGATFVVAPIQTQGGEPLARIGDRFTVAVYPFTGGQAFGWGEFSAPGIRPGLLSLVIGVHTAPAAARRHTLADDFTVPFRAELEAACGLAAEPAAEPAGPGPYARATLDLLTQAAPAIGQALRSYDALVALAAARPGREVITHGEPHPGNAMLTAGGAWVLIDWDTALLAPPERDLWLLDPGDGSVLRAYTEATGVTPEPDLLELYRLRWDITDIALGSRRLLRPHTATADADKTWNVLRELAGRIAPAGRMASS
jgi:hypothetical protein